ncbi:hypothetical protein K503DRAFT_803247 [Rhizopogon vinicolor AM-OR11-026]|uniref:O-methyltransferase C-terminal domain-containing protein n=1 Tax=Rhizopogon vinicolor AM-OR11-026 TaxID=1314800 RepID=A0A1B7MQI2_9AGAM|nr:hypothetical protein K503DRAFT_803247 [Rhizopogon vinicolor AM-OR11-026]
MPTTTFTTLRALHALMGDALDDIQRVFSQSSSPPSSQCSSPAYPASPEPASMPPTPMSSTFSTQVSSYGAPLSPMFDLHHDYPSPALPYLPTTPAEQLAAHPDASAAATRIIAAAGQIMSIVQKPFLFICDATMGYNLPASMRLLEHLHIVEILREAEDERQCVLSELDMRLNDANDESADEPNSRAHPLRLLSTHHILRETAPDTFALTRVASLLDSGKSVASVFANPEKKYEDTTGIAAFVGLCTDELFKSAAYLTEAFTGVQLPSAPHAPPGSAATMPPDGDDTHTSGHLKQPQPIHVESDGRSAKGNVMVETLPAFNLAFNTPVPFFEWLEDGGLDALGGSGIGAGSWDIESAGNEDGTKQGQAGHVRNKSTLSTRSGRELRKSFRLERFSQAMTGTSGWEAPRAILSGFDWLSLPRGSTIVDVGGGIGSTTMILAKAFGGNRGRRESLSSEVDEDEDTVENNTFTTPLSCNNLTPRKSRSDLKSFASRGELKSPVFRVDLKSRASQANLTHKPSHADFKVPSSRGGLDALQPVVSSDDQDMQFRFIVQDRPVVVGLGLAAWRAQCPEMLESRQVVFQDHDFFLPQPALPSLDFNPHPAVYILRVVLHDWPDARARHVLLNLRLASSPETRLIIAEHVLPLACIDEGVHSVKDEHQMAEGEKWTLDSVLAHVEGADSTLAPAPLLPNLGKASANPYWMDIMMDITFNGKERTLRELCALALSSGWRIMRVTYSKGSHFGHLVCEPVDIPEDVFTILPERPATTEPATDYPFIYTEPSEDDSHDGLSGATGVYADNLLSPLGMRSAILPHLPPSALERSSSRRGTSTFGSRVSLPRPDELPSGKPKSYNLGRRWLKARGLGVRSVVEKQKRREEGIRKVDDHDDQGGVSPQQSRVWWKRALVTASPVAEERIGDVSALRLRSGTITPEVPPPLQSPRQYHFPTHRMTPSVQSNLPGDGHSSTSQSRRPSVVSLTRKLNFSPFSRRPSVVDLASTSPRSATFDTVHVQPEDLERNLRHQPSTPMMQRYYHSDGDRGKSIRHHPSAPHLKHGMTRAEEPPPLPTALKVAQDDGPSNVPLPPRKSSLLSGGNMTSLSTAAPYQPSQSIFSSAPTVAPIRAPSMPTESVSPKVKRQPGTPKLLRRLSIPVLRRKREEDA